MYDEEGGCGMQGRNMDSGGLLTRKKQVPSDEEKVQLGECCREGFSYEEVLLVAEVLASVFLEERLESPLLRGFISVSLSLDPLEDSLE